VADRRLARHSAPAAHRRERRLLELAARHGGRDALVQHLAVGVEVVLHFGPALDALLQQCRRVDGPRSLAPHRRFNGRRGIRQREAHARVHAALDRRAVLHRRMELPLAHAERGCLLEVAARLGPHHLDPADIAIAQHGQRDLTVPSIPVARTACG
jgi:hypothetical protein